MPFSMPLLLESSYPRPGTRGKKESSFKKKEASNRKVSKKKQIEEVVQGDAGAREAPTRDDELTQARLRDVLDYDPITGIWTWRSRPEWLVQTNAKYAGKRAGNIDSDTRYWRIRIDDVLYYAHRLAFLYMTGKWPAEEVDHENLDRADCVWVNLREATHPQNGANKVARSDNTSGFKGVSRDKRSGRWTADLTVNGDRFRKCGFETAEAAFEHYKSLVETHCGEHGRVS